MASAGCGWVYDACKEIYNSVQALYALKQELRQEEPEVQMSLETRSCQCEAHCLQERSGRAKGGQANLRKTGEARPRLFRKFSQLRSSVLKRAS
eukprot:11645749-Karenia_brevis.AAC.1